MPCPSFQPVALFFCLGSVLAFPQTANKRALVTQPVDNQSLVTLAGNTRSAVSTAIDRGPVADDLPLEHILMQLQRPVELTRSLDQYLKQQQDPASLHYHHWLTATDFGATFGLAASDIQAITKWLESQGLVVNQVYANQMTIDFSGSAGQIRQAFRTEMHYLDVNGQRHLANMRDPQIPSAFASAVVGIVSLHDFQPHSMKTERMPNYTVGSGEYVVPGDLATIYNLNPLFSKGITGQGQTIAVIEDGDVYSGSDWTTFRRTFGLSAYTSGSFTQTHPGACADPGVVAGTDAEAILDAEWASAAAPGAAIQVASCRDTTTTFGGLIALQNLLNASGTPPALVSISYGECEAENGAAANATYAAAFQQAAAEGASVFVSAGDQGAASCDAGASHATHGIGVNAFASTPYNVAVGGTDFGDSYAGTNSSYWNTANTSTYASAKSYIPEIPWDDSCASSLITNYLGYAVSYGSAGFCNSSSGTANFLNIVAGSGGPSACATGSAASKGIVGGTCQGYAKPSWQAGIFGNPNDSVRDLPDVSLFAGNGAWGHYYVYCWSDSANGGAACSGAPSSWSGAGGTSFSAPIMAGIQALVNQSTASRWGNPAPHYYSLAAAEYGSSGNANCHSSNSPSSSCTFYDVTQGNMDVVCAGSTNCYGASGSASSPVYGDLSTSSTSLTPAYATGNGWDFASGLGSINANNLVTNWNGGTTTTPPTSSASYTGVDKATQGSWTGKYGSDGFQIANDASSALPGYASVSYNGASTYTWAYPTTDTRALQFSSGSASRIASTYYSGGSASFSINVNLTDGNTHRVALYLVDWSDNARNETISITDAASNAVLDTESLTNFDNGQYAVWNIKGNVVITVTSTSTAAGDNPLMSAIFFGAATSAPPTTSSASYGGLDTTTQGSWTGHYGADGFQIANDASSALPAYASLTFNGASTYTWANATTDPRGLQVVSGSGSRIASTYYSGGSASFSINLNLTDGNTHRVALYLLDWSNNARNETISVADAVTFAVLDTESFSNFDNGQYAVWNMKGNVIITVTSTSTAAGDNPLVSAIFFGPVASSTAAAATYGGLDTATEGTWTGKYGADGFQIANDTSSVIPAYASIAYNGATTYTWAYPTTDTRALQSASGSGNRIAATYYSGSSASFSINLNLTDGKTHRIALYLLDWSNNGRSESISIADAVSQTVLDHESFSNFDNGQYAFWNIKGDVVVTITCTSTAFTDNPLVSAVFFN